MKTKHQPLLRWPQRLVRATAWAVLLTFSSNIVIPTLVIAKEADRRAELVATPKRTEFDDVSDTLIQLEEALDRMNRRLQGQWEYEWQAIANRGGQTPPPAAADRAALRALEDELDAAVPRLESLQGAVRLYFAQTGQHIERSGLAPEIRARHDEQTAEYERSYGELKSLLHALKTAHALDEFKTAVAAADAFMKQHSSKPMRAAFDPNAPLAFGPGKHRAGAPRTDAKALRKALGIAEPSAKALARDADTKAAPTAAELAATEDAQLTDAIRAKATELGNNPVAIYNFVRNNVEFLPTYGSIQGADQTLKTLRGNAFDQSSLLIALLRAANIPARYVYGTVEMPIAQVQNWVGGTETPQAALELLGAGGIPNLGLAQGGVIKKAQIEHVWVEAYVDFVPSRGAKNIAGDSWVPLDPSFKQYDLSTGMDLLENISLDGQGFINALEQGGTVNENEGWIQGGDQDAAAQAQAELRRRITTFVEARDSDATVSDVVGFKRIHARTVAQFDPVLPNHVAAIASRSPALSSTLRWSFRFSLDGNVMLERSLPRLASKAMALSFKPATAADQAALESLIPADADGPEDLPTSIPTSLAKLVPEFTIDGVAIASGQVRQLGSEMGTRKGLFVPGRGWIETDNPVVAGNYQAIGLDVAGVSQREVEDLRAALMATKAKVDQRDLGAIGRHDFTGALMQAGVTAYFAETYSKSQLAAQASGMLMHRLPSYGTVSTDSQVQYWFGMPRNFVPKGVIMDMDRMASISVARNGDASKWVSFNKAIGNLLSSHEHGTLETLFDDYQPDAAREEGMSAVKAIAVAAKNGQRIYTIQSSNLNAALSSISLPATVESDIADAVAAGYKVVTHQQEVDYANQRTAGYIIMDEATGSAAYKLSNGTDGGAFWFTFIIVALVIVLAAMALLTAITGGAGLLVIGVLAWALFWAIDTFSDWIERMGEAQNSQEFNQAAFMAVVQSIFTLFATVAAGVSAGAAAAWLFGEWFVKMFDCTWYDDELPWCLF